LHLTFSGTSDIKKDGIGRNFCNFQPKSKFPKAVKLPSKAKAFESNEKIILKLLLLLLDRGLLCKALNMAGQCMDAGNTDYKKGTGGEKWVV
jgi:hypothetical protein